VPGALSPHPDGTGYAVRTPYDPKVLPVLRALPGAKWDPQRKVWRVSDAEADLPALLAAARAHGWAVHDTIAARAAAVAEAQEAGAKAADSRADDPRLYPYQRAGVRWLARQDRALLADDQGLGKTAQTLMALPDRAPVLVIAPAAVKYVWRDEAAQWRPDYRASVLAGRGSFRWPEPGEAVVVNFDILPKPDADLPPAPAGCVLIVDEAANCKNRRARRTQAVARLARECATVYGLSGTPMRNNPPELFQVLDTLGLAERAFGSFGRFYRAFNARKHPSGMGTLWGAPRPEVPQILARVMLRREKAAVLPELPPKRWQDVAVNGVTPAMRRELDAVGAEWNDWIAERPKERQDQLPPFEMMSEVRAAIAVAKVPTLLQMIEPYEEAGEPLVVFSAHRAPVDALAERAGWARISGSESAEQRAETVRRFQAGELRGVACTIQAGGTGLTLTRASTMIFVDLAWTPADNAQAADRIHRIGQAEACLYLSLVMEHPVERRVAKLLSAKARLIAKTIAPAATTTAPPTLTETLAAGLPTKDTTPRPAPRPTVSPEALPPAGGYALDTQAGATNGVAFWLVDRPTHGKWAGWTFLRQQLGPEAKRAGAVRPDGSATNAAAATTLARIAADPRGAAVRYGKELGVCSVCLSQLTSEWRLKGIGPVCARKREW